MKRGASTLITATLIAGIALSTFISVFVISQRRSGMSILSIQSLIEYTDLHEVTKLAITILGNEATIKNLGSSPVELDYIVSYAPEGVRIEKISEISDCRLLTPDGGCRTTLTRGSIIAVVTTKGVIIHPVRIEVESPPPEAALIIPITFDFNDIDSMAREFGIDPELVVKPYPGGSGKRGMSGSRVLMLPRGREDEHYNKRISTVCQGVRDNRVPFGVLVVSYDPNWVIESRSNPTRPPRYSILIAGPHLSGQEKLCLSDGGSIPLTQRGFRVKIQNFVGTIRIYDRSGSVLACASSNSNECGNYMSAVGVWYFGIDRGWTVYLDGIAGYIGYYQRDPSAQGQPSNYEPYLNIGDIDGNGLVDIIYITEDAYYGSIGELNDRDLIDWSTEPLKLMLARIGRVLGSDDGWIDGSSYAGLVLYLNLLFHDNSYPDDDQLEDIDRTDWVLRVLLVDEYRNELIIREYRYQEICNYHKTLIERPGEDNYFTKLSQSIYIPIPPRGRYRVVIAIQDPYSSLGNQNDADITIGIEIIGVLPLSR